MQAIIKIRLEGDEIPQRCPYAELIESRTLHQTGTAKRLRKEMGIDDLFFERMRAKARSWYYKKCPRTTEMLPSDLKDWDTIGLYLSRLFSIHR